MYTIYYCYPPNATIINAWGFVYLTIIASYDELRD